MSQQRIKAQIAQTAARLMQELGVRDFSLAKKKAARELKLSVHHKDWPENQQIALALEQRLALFAQHRHASHLEQLRQAAIHAMQLLQAYQPRLVGAVLSGVVLPTTPVEIHLFCDAPELPEMTLQEHGIPYDLHQASFEYRNGERQSYPCIEFMAGEAALSIVIFPEKAIRQAPKSSLDGQPMTRAKLRQVKSLVK